METKNYLKKELPILIVVFLPLLFILIVKNQLNSLSQINWIDPKQISTWILLLSLMGLNILIYGLLLFVQRLTLKRVIMKYLNQHFTKFDLLFLYLWLLITGLFIASNSGIVIDEIKIIRISTFVLLAVIGNYVYNVKPNWFIGFRTPWTLDNEMVWRKTHHLEQR
jgi:uncharacterized membrane protein